MRVEFTFDEKSTSREQLESDCRSLLELFGARWKIHCASSCVRMAVAVSKVDHCLMDILYRVNCGDLNVGIPMVIGNHETLRPLVERHGIPFHYLPVTPDTRDEQEADFLKLIKGSTDFLVLARYMQILSQDFLDGYGKDIINIHHSFLPSFKGANPYRQAYERGVKIIGATAHYATLDLDEGPIIEQVVEHVSHRDDVESLRRKGRNLEQLALARAIQLHVDHRVIRFKNKTIVFE